MANRKKPPNFEQSLKDLEHLVEALEAGNLSLEDSLKAFENGVRITRDCQEALRTAEQKVSILMQDSQGAISEDVFGGAEDEQ